MYLLYIYVLSFRILTQYHPENQLLPLKTMHPKTDIEIYLHVRHTAMHLHVDTVLLALIVDEHRVVLSMENDSDYINASYIRVSWPHAFFEVYCHNIFISLGI